MAGDDGGDDDGIDFSDSFGDHGWPAWTILMLMSFWGLACVCEDFFVPALNVLCIKLNLPDDVAGATFMAAGASSPELFSAIISLFVTKSALGIGTIIGSEIFNHLCICSGSIMYSKTGTLVLDFRILAREVIFYGLAIIALLYCESDTRKCSNSKIDQDKCNNEWDDSVGTDQRIYLQWYKPLILLLMYVLYVFVCAYYLRLIDLFCPRKDEGRDDSLPSSTKKSSQHTSIIQQIDPSSSSNDDRDVVHPRSTIGSFFVEPAANFEPEKEYGDITPLPLFDKSKMQRNSFDNSVPSSRLSGSSATSSSSSHHDQTLPPLSGSMIRNTIDLGVDNTPAPSERALRNSTGSTVGSAHHNSVDARHVSQGKTREAELRRALDGPAIFSVRTQLVQGALGVGSVVAPNTSMMLGANLHAVEASPDQFSCYLWKHSRFYSRIRMSSKAWQLKWVTIDSRGFRSCRDRSAPTRNVRPFNIYSARSCSVLDPLRLTFIIRIPSGNLTFQAPSQLILEQAIAHIRNCIGDYSRLPDEQQTELYQEALMSALSQDPGISDASQSMDHRSLVSHSLNMDIDGELNDEDDAEDEDVESLLEWPHGGYFSIFIHVVLLPLKIVLHYTIPDVRYVASRHLYMISIGMCFFWLITLSFVMTISVEALAHTLNIDDAVAGLTISAAGTSFPNLVASMIVARQGLGNMAVSNAFGSNVFNVFMGLGIPWLAYCFFAPGGVEVNTKYHTYHGLEAKGVLIPTVFLLVTLILFMLLLLSSGMKLYTWHGYLFVGTYLLFLVWAIGWECSVPPSWPQTF
jgi:Ca2+/Na+ antiporter